MNSKLIFKLSLFGLFMAIATVYFIPSNIEPVCWLVIFIICAYFIAKQCAGKYFLNGFSVSLVNCVWITGAHILLYHTYIANHPQEAAMLLDAMKQREQAQRDQLGQIWLKRSNAGKSQPVDKDW